MRYLLGIDVGTTGTKTLLFREDGQCMGHAYCSYETTVPRVGFSEQNPLDWWQAVVQTVRQVCADPEIAQQTCAISLSTQGGTTVPVDENFHPVRPAMVWNDTRCVEQQARFSQKFGADTLYQKTGWGLVPGQNLMQIRWMKENEPDLFAQTRWFLSVPDYISCKLTGIPAIDPSNMGINQLGDIRRCSYDSQLLDFAGIKEDQLPAILPSGTIIGQLTSSAAQVLGLRADVVLVAGVHDQYAVALGSGCSQDGDILIGSGTCWVATCIADEPDFDSGLSQSIAAVPGRWGSLWSLSSGGICLEWWRKNLTADKDGTPIPYSQINEEVTRRKAAENGLFFFPFSGISSLESNLSKASFIGLDLFHDKYDMARAIMEGVAFQIAWMLDRFKTKPSPEGIKLSGGASKSQAWCQMVADIAAIPVVIPETADLACVGAAILAGIGSKVFRNTEDGYRRMSIPTQTIYPNPEASEMYAMQKKKYQHYAKLIGDGTTL